MQLKVHLMHLILEVPLCTTYLRGFQRLIEFPLNISVQGFLYLLGSRPCNWTLRYGNSLGVVHITRQYLLAVAFG